MTGDEWMIWIAKILGTSLLIPIASYCLYRLTVTGLDQHRKRRADR